MHELFYQVLNRRDLSKAGDLFSVEDTDIASDLSEVLNKIQEISSAPEYLSNDNNQSVVEICITRVTSAIRFVVLSSVFWPLFDGNGFRYIWRVLLFTSCLNCLNCGWSGSRGWGNQCPPPCLPHFLTFNLAFLAKQSTPWTQQIFWIIASYSKVNADQWTCSPCKSETQPSPKKEEEKYDCGVSKNSQPEFHNGYMVSWIDLTAKWRLPAHISQWEMTHFDMVNCGDNYVWAIKSGKALKMGLALCDATAMPISPLPGGWFGVIEPTSLLAGHHAVTVRRSRWCRCTASDWRDAAAGASVLCVYSGRSFVMSRL